MAPRDFAELASPSNFVLSTTIVRRGERATSYVLEVLFL